MEIQYFQNLSSTQLFLLEKIRSGELSNEVLIWTEHQTAGIGSRGNEWIGEKGNLFFSFSKKISSEIPKQSLSLYFALLFKKTLQDLGSKLFLKWPNDFYLQKKFGGVIANISKDFVIVGIGINRKEVESFEKLDLEIENLEILEHFAENLKELPNWAELFEDFKLDFEKSRKFSINSKNSKISLEDAILNFDGSVTVENCKYFR